MLCFKGSSEHDEQSDVISVINGNTAISLAVNESNKEKFNKSINDGISVNEKDKDIVKKSWNLVVSYVGPSEGKTGVSLFTDVFMECLQKELSDDEKLIFEFSYGMVFQVQEVMRMIAVMICAVVNYDSFKSSILEFCIKPRLFSMDAKGIERFRNLVSTSVSTICSRLAIVDKFGQPLETSALKDIAEPEKIKEAWESVVTAVGKIIFDAQNYAKSYFVFFPVHYFASKWIKGGIIITSDTLHLFHDRKCSKVGLKIQYKDVAQITARLDEDNFPSKFGVVISLKNNQPELHVLLDSANGAKQFEQNVLGRYMAYQRISHLETGLAADIKKLQGMKDLQPQPAKEPQIHLHVVPQEPEKAMVSKDEGKSKSVVSSVAEEPSSEKQSETQTASSDGEEI
jgi:hypothetical protein